jgi:predicted PurR-regulated permease PerM
MQPSKRADGNVDQIDGGLADRRRRRFVLALFLIALALLGIVISPFIGAFFSAALLGAILYPWQVRLTRCLGGRQGLAAGLLTVAAILVVVIPVGGLSVIVVAKGVAAVDWVSQQLQDEGVDGLIEPLPTGVREPARRAVGLLPPSLLDALGILPPAKRTRQAAGEPQEPAAEPGAPAKTSPSEGPGNAGGGAMTGLGNAASAAGGAVVSVFDLLLRIGLVIVALFFCLTEGRRLVDYVVDMVPLPEERTRSVLARARAIALGILMSMLATAFAQTVIALIGYWIAGMPQLLLVTGVTFVFAFVPALGGAAVTLVAGVFLLLTGSTVAGIFLVIWAITAVGLIDNLVKPYVAKGGTRLPGSLVFFAMICGLAVFGPTGLVAGPLVVAFFQVCAEMLREDGDERTNAVAVSAVQP